MKVYGVDVVPVIDSKAKFDALSLAHAFGSLSTDKECVSVLFKLLKYKRCIADSLDTPEALSEALKALESFMRELIHRN